MSVLSPALDLRDALAEILEVGIGHAPDALDGDSCERLRSEVDPLPFQEMDRVVGPYGVRQEGEAATIGDTAGTLPTAAGLGEELVALVRDQGAGIVGLDQWRPNEIAVQRYLPGSTGITAHRDHKRYRYLIAVCTIQGQAPFLLCADRAGTVTRQWEVGPGALMLLRGPGLGGVADGRPLHAVRGPAEGVRTSLAFRMSPDV